MKISQFASVKDMVKLKMQQRNLLTDDFKEVLIFFEWEYKK